MSKIIAVVTQKGGVGKTTTANGLAAAYVTKGFRVLCIDMDPQRNLSFSVGANYEDSATIYHVLKSEVPIQFAIQHLKKLDFIPSSALLSGIDLEFTGKDRQYLLGRALEGVREQYDYIIIDCPPNLGILTANALVAADYVIVPAESDLYSLQGLVQLFETIAYVKEHDNPSLVIAGVLLTKYRARYRLTREVLGTAEMMCDSLDIPLLATKIRDCIALREAQNLQCDIMEYGRYSNGGLDYMALTDELIGRGV